jgi:hypothetical protein
MNKGLLVLLCGCCLCSCEKNIDFKLNDAANELVVDASIENGKVPVVVLTRSVSFFSEINPSILAGSFVHNAEVYMSNGTVTHRLKEYSFPLAPGYVAWFFSIDSTNMTTAFAGELNRQYTLKIITGGKEYHAAVSIPPLAAFPDSIWLKKAPMNPDSNARVFFMRATDPPGLGNCARYFTKKNGGPFLPGENSVFDDQVIDGTTYAVQLPQGIDKNAHIKADSNFFKKGDTVTLRFSNIERPVYRFWSTWEFAQQSVGNPFAQPNKVIGNISNGALGVFCGYASWYGTVVAE